MTDTTPHLTLPGEEAIEIGKHYLIQEASEFHSDVQGYRGYRIVLDGGEDDVLVIPLWYKEVASRTSKLGSFMVALGEDIKTWKGKRVALLVWEDKNRKVVEVQ